MTPVQSSSRNRPGPTLRAQDDLKEHHKSRLLSLLRSVGLHVAYHRGEADFLYYNDPQGREVEVLDLVGGYGSLLLGHSHPAIVAEAQDRKSLGKTAGQVICLSPR